MSQRNGDKAKFNRQRKHKILQRKRIRELQTGIGSKKAEPGVTAQMVKDQAR